MRVAITGAGGFIGQWLMRELKSHGYEVFGVSKNKIEGVECLDLLAPGMAATWLSIVRPDVCIHLAAYVGRMFGEEDRTRTLRSNAEMTTNVAAACGGMGIRLVYASTSEVYGDWAETWLDEYEGPFKVPHNIYGLSKRWGEEVCQLYAPDDLVICRISMPYGPGVPPGKGRRAMDTMLWQAHNRMPLTVHRGAERSWCWVGVTVRGIRMTLEHPESGVYNVGRDNDVITMLDLAKKACSMTGAPPSLIEEVDPPGRQTVLKRLSTKRLEGLGWKPTVDLDTGMQAVLDWVKQYDAEGNFREDTGQPGEKVVK